MRFIPYYNKNIGVFYQNIEEIETGHADTHGKEPKRDQTARKF